MSQGKPKKLFFPRKSDPTSGSMKLDATVIKKIAQQVGNRKLVIISVNGSARTGKSLLLSNMIKYLSYGHINGKWIHALAENGMWFKCDGGSNRVTTGIEVWSEPFYMKGKDGEEIGVVLMDTQGLFDDQTDLEQNATIFALSSLLSSVTVYNSMGGLNDMDWQFLELLSSYVDLNNESPSALCFFLRDWQHTDDFPIGLHTKGSAGKSLIDFLFDTEGMFVDAAESRKAVQRRFSEIFAYALPHPGKHLAEEDYYLATAWSKDFKKSMKGFIETLFSQEYLSKFCKKIGKEEITGNDFMNYVEKWERHFVSGDLPTVRSLYATTAEIQFQQGVASYQNKAKGFLENLFSNGDQPVTNFEEVLMKQFKSLEETWEEKVKRFLGAQEFKEEYAKKLKEHFSILQRDYTLINEERKVVARQREEVRRVEGQRRNEEAQGVARKQEIEKEQAAVVERARQEQERLRRLQLELQQQMEDSKLEAELNASYRSQGKNMIARVTRRNGQQEINYEYQ